MKYIYFFAILVLCLIIFAVLNFGKQDTYQLFFYNEKADKNLNEGIIECDPRAVLPITRVTKNKPNIEQTLKLLVEGGPLPEEQVQGFTSEFPHKNFTLENVAFTGGILSLTFTEVSGFTSGGSCRINLLKTQIEKTALQFDEVKEVRILPEEILQP